MRASTIRQRRVVRLVTLIAVLAVVAVGSYILYYRLFGFESTVDPRCAPHAGCRLYIKISDVQLSSAGLFKMKITNDGNVVITKVECTISGGLKCPPISLQSPLQLQQTLIVEGSTGITAPIEGRTYTVTVTVSNPNIADGTFETWIHVVATA